MNIQISELTAFVKENPKHWNELLSQLPYNHALQSYQWGQFKSRHGWSSTYFIFLQDETVRGAALVLQRKMPRLPWSIMYVPKGPALDYSDTVLVEHVLSHLEQLALQRKALIIKIDPDVSFESDEPDWIKVQQRVSGANHPIAASSPIIQLLERRGWKLSQEQIQFKNTLLIDLGQSEEELLARMKSKTRYNIRLAARKGVEVRIGKVDDLVDFYQLYSETGDRDNFLIRPFDYYRDVWESFLKNDMADLLLAESSGKLLAGLLVFRLGRKAWYMYGASSNEQRNLMPNYLLQWEAMILSKQKNCLLYDLWGAPDILDEQDPLWGVYKFKKGLGGELSCHIGAYDFPIHPVWSKIYSWALPRYLDFLRYRHHHTSNSE